MTRLAQYRLLWRAALAMMHPRAPRVFPWLMPVLALAAAALGGGGMGWSGAIGFGWNTPFIILLATWTWVFLPGAFKLNTPANAQLVPGMRDRLLELSAVSWLGCVVGLVIGASDSSPDLSLRLLWFLMASLGMGLAAGSSAIGSWLLIAIWPLMVVRSYLPAAALDAVAHPAFLPLAAALLAVPGLVAIRAMFPRAGERHWRMLACRNIWRDRDVFDKLDGRTFMGWWHARSLRRAGRRRDLGGILLHGSGPGLDLGGTLFGIGILGVPALALLAWAHLGGHDGALAVAADIGWLWALAPLLLFQTHALLLASLSPSTGGHGLLRLAPLLPATAPQFNWLLAARMLRSALASWAMTAVAGFAFALLCGATPRQLASFAGLCCLVLPFINLPLRNHARRPRWNAVLQWLLTAAAGGACLLAGVFMAAVSGFPVLLTAAAVSVVATACFAARRFHTMVRAPFAFPAGRLA